jgi:hypothetical protein
MRSAARQSYIHLHILIDLVILILIDLVILILIHVLEQQHHDLQQQRHRRGRRGMMTACIG